MKKTLNTLMNEKDINFKIIGDCMLDRQDLINGSLKMTVQNMGDHYRVFTEIGVYIADIVFIDDGFTDFNTEDEEEATFNFYKTLNKTIDKIK